MPEDAPMITARGRRASGGSAGSAAEDFFGFAMVDIGCVLYSGHFFDRSEDYNFAVSSPYTKILDWLLAGDHAIRWQVQRDLLGEKPAVYERERAKVASEGWGARYLVAQDKAGTWAKALYSPKWTSTHYTLLTLRFLGLPPKNAQALKACRVLLDKGFLPDHGIRYARSIDTEERRRTYAETCITGMALALFAYFQLEDKRVDLIAEHLLNQQMGDGGWNCQSYRGDTHSSFNTTLLVLDGLQEYQGFRPKSKLPLAPAIKSGREFLLQHHLYKSDRTRKIVKAGFLLAPAQPSWQYDFLRALDHFQAARAPKDARLQDAIGLLLGKRDKDGRWAENRAATGKRWFTMETVSKPGRWNTLRALRVLKWWENKSIN
jgi:hypothetical protein